MLRARPSTETPSASRAFTLVELLAVIGVMAILALLIVPQVNAFQARSKSLKCMSNMRQIGAAFQQYASEHNGRLPVIYNSASTPAGETNAPWMWKLSPYVGMAPDSMGFSPLPRAAGVFVCPEWTMSPPRNTTRAVSYAVNNCMDPHSSFASWNYRAMSPPPSSTILMVEVQANTETFNPNTDGDVTRRHPQSSANFLFLDGHVENIADKIPVSDPRWFRK